LSSRALEKIVMDSDIHIRIHIRGNQASSLRFRVFFIRSMNRGWQLEKSFCRIQVLFFAIWCFFECC
jgi:hypothetical protein